MSAVTDASLCWPFLQLCSFVFDDEALEVVIAGTEKPTDNKFVGGRNRWAYDTFINWVRPFCSTGLGSTPYRLVDVA